MIGTYQQYKKSHKADIPLHYNFENSLERQRSKMLQKKEEGRLQSCSSSYKITIAAKILVMVTRICIFIFDLWMKDFDISTCLISMATICGTFIVAEIFVWYFSCKRQFPQEWSSGFTIGTHLFALFNIVLVGLTAPLAEVAPHENYFSICFGEMMNYLLTLVEVYMILNEVFIKNFDHFVTIYEPVDNSLAYLFLAIYAGMLLDMLAFSGRSMNYFYMMTFLLFIYFIVRIILSNISRDLKKILFME